MAPRRSDALRAGSDSSDLSTISERPPGTVTESTKPKSTKKRSNGDAAEGVKVKRAKTAVPKTEGESEVKPKPKSRPKSEVTGKPQPKPKAKKEQEEKPEVNGMEKDTKAKAKLKSPAAVSKATVKAEAKAKPKAVKSAAKGKASPKSNGAPKAKGTPKANGTPKPKAAPRAKVPKRVVAPEPERPRFERIDTRLGREEAEQRIMLREYLFRFRPVLGFPERSLFPVDDFDRPLTEANVRLFAGAMIEVIKDEIEGVDREEDEELFNIREELRYYADVARFAAIYQILEKPLDLRLPPPIVDTRTEANNAALRALLDLDEDQPAPAWATDLSAGPSRRTGASRSPPSSEVTRMLLALAERTLAAPRIKKELDDPPSEYLMQRAMNAERKKEIDAWFPRKKKMEEGLVRCSTAAATKQLQEEILREEKDYLKRMDQLDANLWSDTRRTSLRSGPLGTDLDGRIYYLLSPRLIEGDGRAPLGWASGLLVWGKALPPSKADIDDSDMPFGLERWSHFGKSAQIGVLIRWLDWQYTEAIEQAKEKAAKTARSKTAKEKASKGTPLKGTLSKATPGSTPTGTSKPGWRQRSLLEVVIPSNRKNVVPSNGTPLSSNTSVIALEPMDDDSVDNDDASSTSSGLTPPPEARTEELLALLELRGYEPSAEKLEEDRNHLRSQLYKTQEWLEVLEWKGLGEVA
ncbi:hypothetical protein IAU60_003934 [Kwoniella sp. DSM 27419]